MAYVVTQSCCADASCVVACPVNCIHPAPGEPGFATAEMLFVDPRSCVGCGACASACPVDAVKPESMLTPQEQPFLALNADYYAVFPHPDRRPLAPVAPHRRLTRQGPHRIAVVGAGPAGLYAADELLGHPGISVDVYDRLPTPYGLVRAGVAPDHPRTKRVERLFRAIEEQPGFGYLLGVEVGRDVGLDELRTRYHAVVHAGGASDDRRLGLEGEDLPGSLPATELVGWYNGHPDRQDLDVPLDDRSRGRAVVVGTGNVALDVARVLLTDAADLEPTDIAALPLEALRRSEVREVVLLGRRGPADAAFTLPELVGLAGLARRGAFDVVVEAPTAQLADLAGDGRALTVLRELAERTPTPGRRRLVLRFGTRPTAILGRDRVEGLEVESTGRAAGAAGDPAAREVLETGLLVRAIGYRGRPVPGLPHDEARGVVPNDGGRVEPGLYVAGWAKRGPSGFIGTNKACSAETVARLLDDLDAGACPEPTAAPDPPLGAIDLAGWRAIDAEERRRGAALGRARVKLVDVAELREVATRPRAGAAAPRGYPSLKRLVRGRGD